MFRQLPVSSAVQRAIYGAALVTAAATIPVTANAQAGASDQTEYLEEIITTGSRIKQDANLTSSAPVTTVDAGEIVNRGITRVEDLVNDLPQIVPELTANESNGATGTATLDLRGLGSDRTLVLTNGHRMGLGNPFALSPDVNQVPGVLIERVELLTGGASSVYGADAVAGVVNFIMKNDFEGFLIDYQFSAYQHKNSNGFAQNAVNNAGFDLPKGTVSDGHTRNINVVMGLNSDDGAGNLTAYLGFRDINSILQADRDYSACALSSRNGETCAGSATLPTGLFTPFDGSVYYTVAGDEFVPWDYTYYNYAPLNYFQRPDERITAGLFGNYAIDERTEGYVEIQFMDDRSLAQIAPSGAFFVTDEIKCSNAFLSAQQFGALGCVDDTDVVPFYIGRRNVEGGPRFDDLRHTAMRSLVGVRGDIGENWEYDVYANFSRTRYSQVYNNDLSTTRIIRALDAVDDGNGNAVCQSVIDGSDPSCVPWNVFATGGVTQEAIDYLVLPLFAKADLEQNQIVGYVSGDLTDAGIKLPTASEGLKVVLGYEYRTDEMDFNPDGGFRSGDGAGQGGPIPAVNGSIAVKEIFTEVRVPIVQDKPFAESIALDIRYRYSDYDLDIQTDTWNVGGEWRPTEDIMIRGGVSTAVRAPNLNELFQPSSFGLWSGTDPCAGPTPELSQTACENTGVTAAQYGSVPFSPAGQYNGIFGGNAGLAPEESDSFTFGAVFTPSFLDGFSLSVDYWHIEVAQAISSGIGEEFTIRQCGATGDPSFCNLISRGPNGNLWVGSANIRSTDINIGFFEVAGIDFTGTFKTEIGDYGSLDFAFRGTMLETWDEQPVPGGDINDCAGFWGGSCGRPRPDWKHTFTTVWNSHWDAQFVLGWRHVGEVKEFALDRFTAKSVDYIDLSANYSAEIFGTVTTFNIGMSNVFDEDPPVYGLFNNVSVYGNGNTIPGTWDAMGRYYFVGLNVAF